VEDHEKDRFRIHPVSAFGSTREIGPVDLVMIGLKATARDAIAELLPPLLGENTGILTLQNGLGAEEHLAEMFGKDRVIGGLCFICLNRVGPASIECYHPGTINIGAFDRPPGQRVAAIADAFNRAGVRCSVASDLAEARWRKLVWNVPFNGLSIAAGGITTDRILQDPELLEEVRDLMREIQTAASHLGHSIPDSFLEKQVAVTYPMGAYKPSSLVDFLDGRSVEIEAIWGEPLKRARAAGLAMPRLASLYDRLRDVCRNSNGP
jgi:2-dehydropantoate 2-reductase